VKFFLPDWDDRVDPGYDFATDRSTYRRDPATHDIYAHECFGDEPCYDGILISRSALPEKGAKRRRIDEIGLRRALRLPASYELLGDCGAFGYADQPEPTYDTAEVLQFYQRVGVDYGVSVDHIIFPAYPEQRTFRYDLTIRNAVEFLRLHRAGGFRFTPVGAVQGWDEDSYRKAARVLVDAGYEMLAVGGLVRTTTAALLGIVSAIVDEVGPGTRLHLLGVARDALTPQLDELGIFSFDSASPMRTAWTSATKNYLLGPRHYTAIRIPFVDPNVDGTRSDNILTRTAERTTYAELERMERAALKSVRAYGRHEAALDDAMDAVARYDMFQTRRLDGPTSRDSRLERYRRTLNDRPWDRCDCLICSELGVDVLIFRGNNRNRRRGFHNVRDFYVRLKSGEDAVSGPGGPGKRHEREVAHRGEATPQPSPSSPAPRARRSSSQRRGERA
jgi:hypothetical protein